MIKKPKNGFTLIELLVVIAIIALLIGIVLVWLGGARAQTRDAKRKAEVDSIRAAVEMHYPEQYKYPIKEEWCKLEEDGEGNPCFTGDPNPGSFQQAIAVYLPQVPKDPLYGKTKDTGDPFSYQYKTNSEGTEYKIHVELETGGSYEWSSAGGGEIVYGGGGEGGGGGGDIFTLEVTTPFPGSQVAGNTYIAELKLTNNTANPLLAEGVWFYVEFEGQPFDGIGIKASFRPNPGEEWEVCDYDPGGSWTDWSEGKANFSNFEFPPGTTAPEVKIDLHPALMPGSYYFLFHLKSDTQEAYVDLVTGTVKKEWASPPPGYALKFDGTDDYIEVPDSNSLDITEEITIEAWIKANSVTPRPDWSPVVVKKCGYAECYGILVTEDQTFLYFFVQTGGVSFAGEEIQTGEWLHVAGSWDRTSPNNIDLYFNGVKLGEGPVGTGAPPVSSLPALIGGATVNYGDGTSYCPYYFDGIIDEVRIYAKRLPESLIAAHYQGDFSGDSTGCNGGDCDLRTLWHFNEGFGSTTADTSGNGNNGVLINNPQWVSVP